MTIALRLEPLAGDFSLKGPITDALRRAILDVDVFDPGAQLRLDERTIADRLGISRTPIREAFTRLEQEGLVEVRARRGVFVRRPGLDEVLDMITVWAALESMAAYLASTKATEAERADLTALAEESGEPGDYSETNIAFHRRILDMAHSPRTSRIAEGLFDQLKPVRRRAMADRARIAPSRAEHAEIASAIAAGEADRAGALVRAHTFRLKDYLRDHWPALTGETREAGLEPA